MEPKEFNLNRVSEAGGSGGGGGGGDGFIDRSRVRILLCDNNEYSSEEVFTLLVKCSYQVTSVKSPRQVIDALNAEGPDIDLILAEVDLPMNKGMKMLKYITRDKDLRRIPVIMMSAQDEVSTVVKCLKLGAADYLVKPLRTNELLNLWTHMWRRRLMLGLAEKNLINYVDLVISDPSGSNTNSTTLFSDDTEDKACNPETGTSAPQEDKSASVAVGMELPLKSASEFRPDVPGISDRQSGKFFSAPKKSELKIGESSAFFTYVKSSQLTINSQVIAHGEDIAAEHLKIEEKHQACSHQVVDDPQVHGSGEAWESCSQGDDLPTSNSILDSLSLEQSSTPPGSMERQHQKSFDEDRSSLAVVHPRNQRQHDFSAFHAQAAYQYYLSGAVNQVMMSSSTQAYQKNPHDMHSHNMTAMMPQYNHLPHCHPHGNGMGSFSYYPVSVCMQPGQMPNPHSWPSFGNSPSTEANLNKVDRREAALIKFRQKRKERCFDKKIRYVNRKRLAERRPRVRGQFVRKINGVDVDLNGEPASVDDEEEEDEELASRDSSPEGGAS